MIIPVMLITMPMLLKAYGLMKQELEKEAAVMESLTLLLLGVIGLFGFYSSVNEAVSGICSIDFDRLYQDMKTGEGVELGDKLTQSKERMIRFQWLITFVVSFSIYLQFRVLVFYLHKMTERRDSSKDK